MKEERVIRIRKSMDNQLKEKAKELMRKYNIQD